MEETVTLSPKKQSAAVTQEPTPLRFSPTVATTGYLRVEPIEQAKEEKLKADTLRFVRFCRSHIDLIKEMKKYEEASQQFPGLLDYEHILLEEKKSLIKRLLSCWDFPLLEDPKLGLENLEKVFATKEFAIACKRHKEINESANTIKVCTDKISDIKKALPTAKTSFDKVISELKQALSQENITLSEALEDSLDDYLEKYGKPTLLDMLKTDYKRSFSDLIDRVSEDESTETLEQGLAKLAEKRGYRKDAFLFMLPDCKKIIEAKCVGYLNDALSKLRREEQKAKKNDSPHSEPNSDNDAPGSDNEAGDRKRNWVYLCKN